jgi:hypothetical protein
MRAFCAFQSIEVEAAFKNLKDDLRLRPIYLQLEGRESWVKAGCFAGRSAPRIVWVNSLTSPGKLISPPSPLVSGANPVIVADRCARSQAGLDRLVEIAEILQCPVVAMSSANALRFASSFKAASRRARATT